MTEMQCPENQLAHMQKELLLLPQKSLTFMSLFKEA